MTVFDLGPSKRTTAVFGILFFSLYAVKIGLSIFAVFRYGPVLFANTVLFIVALFILLFSKQWETLFFKIIVIVGSIVFFVYLLSELVFLLPPLDPADPFISYLYTVSVLLVFAAIGFCAFFFHPLFSSFLLVAGVLYFLLLGDKVPENHFLSVPHLSIFSLMDYLLFLLARILNKRYTREKEMVQELAKAKERLIQQEKLSVLTTFAAGIVHEISNPLTHMHGNLDFLSGYIDVMADAIRTGDRPAKRPETLDFIEKDVREILTDYRRGFQRMKEITQSLKQFFRRKGSHPDLSDLSGVLKTSVEYFMRYEALVEFITRIEPDMPLICNAGDFLGIFQNILSNAVEAVDHKGTVWVTARRKEGMYSFSIRDNGSGIPKEMIEKISDPFFTTKTSGENMGIGLTLCKNLVETYNGILEVTSTLGEFTEVTVIIPAD